MQCGMCLSAERLRVAGTASAAAASGGRDSPLLCSTCGGPLAASGSRDRLVAKLAQLARFGLVEPPLFGAERRGG